MEIKDLVGLSKPLEKLIDVVAQGIGGVSKPYLTRANANSEAYRIEKITSALAEATTKSGAVVEYKDGVIGVQQSLPTKSFSIEDKTLAERTDARIVYQEQKRTENIEKITSAAAQYIVDEEQVSDGPLDEDWIARFFDSAQDVSTEHMQQLWSKILAGEVKEPGAYSMRTLEFLKNMSRVEAQCIAKIGQYAVQGGSDIFLFDHCESWLTEQREIAQQDIIHLTEIGVINSTQLQFQVTNSRTVLGHGTMGVSITAPESKKIPALLVWKFTPHGSELLKLIDQPDDEAYLQIIADGYKKKAMIAHKLISVQRHADGKIYSQQTDEL